MEKKIFVFGSNLGGRHGAGAAKVALREYGAEYGVGVGLTGSAYAIPTKDELFDVLPISTIELHVKDFIEFATMKPNWGFKVTQVGCGLAGFRSEDIAPLFKNAPSNCFFDAEWKPFLGDSFNYWGTY